VTARRAALFGSARAGSRHRVAKSRFAGTPVETEVLRGKSKRPLYVTSPGITLETAKGLIRNMHCRDRLPTLLTAVDRACRGLDPVSNPE